jgi:hypothetical protein
VSDLTLQITDEEFGKGQAVRLVDVFLLGPLMTWAGYRIQQDAYYLRQPGEDTLTQELAGQALFLSGIATIVFNGYNYVRLRNRTGRSI